MRTPHDVLIRGDRDGRLSLWKQDREKDIASEGLVECIHTSLSETWNKDNVALVNEKVISELSHHNVTPSPLKLPYQFLTFRTTVTIVNCSNV